MVNPSRIDAIKKTLISLVLSTGCTESPSSECLPCPERFIDGGTVKPSDCSKEIEYFKQCNELLVSNTNSFALKLIKESQTHLELYGILIDDKSPERGVYALKQILSEDYRVLKTIQGVKEYLSDEAKFKVDYQLGELEDILTKKTF